MSKLETNPKTQFRFNKLFLYFWLGQIPLIPILMILLPKVWLQIGVMYVAEGTIWGVVMTHFVGMTAALGAMTSQESNDDIQIVTGEVQDLYDTVFQAPGAVFEPERQ